MNRPAPSLIFPTPRVTPNALHAFGGIWRLTSRRFFTPTHWLALAGVFAVVALLGYGASSGRNGPANYIDWAARIYVCVLVSIVSFISAANAMRDDLKPGAIDYQLTRPVLRPAYVVFRYLAHVACAQIESLLALAVVIGVGLFREAPRVWEAVPLLLLAQGLVVMAFSAFGFLCGMLTSRHVVIGLLYGGIIEIGVGKLPTQVNRLSMIRQVRGILQPIIEPDGGSVAGPMMAASLGTPATIALLLGFSVVMVAAAAAIFHWREPAGGASREA